MFIFSELTYDRVGGDLGHGDPFLICIEIEGTRYWGAVFSYYEFKHSLDDQLTDEAWQAMSPRPPLPPWTALYLAERVLSNRLIVLPTEECECPPRQPALLAPPASNKLPAPPGW